ncbi:kinase-like domain-containing protein [Aspergillus ambiguus]|uniref:kinase-like domain-containing protein n=1 Tax=Aspergillus ambiguus TaxID=176160 RepID=UPI003CCCF8CF
MKPATTTAAATSEPLSNILKNGVPSGTHICLGYEPMREPLWLFQNRLKNQRIPLGLLKSYVKLILKGLDYLYSECNIIHTDLKVVNILVGKPRNPMPQKIKDDRTVYFPHNDFGDTRSYYILPKITDFGVAHHQGASSVLNRHLIQPDDYRAPEVIGTTRPISQAHNDDSSYNPAAHLAEMIALRGPPLKELLRRKKEGLMWLQPPKMLRAKFEFLRKDLIPCSLKIKDTVNALEGEQKAQFLSFAKKLLQWLPDDRNTAKALFEDPWLNDESIRKGI